MSIKDFGNGPLIMHDLLRIIWLLERIIWTLADISAFSQIRDRDF